MVRLAGSWDESLQSHVTELNLRFLEVLAGAAAGAGGGLQSPVVLELKSEWRVLSARQMQMLARCPYLLLDAAFGVPEHWRATMCGAVHEAAPPGRNPVSALGTELVRRTLVLAWHLARANPLAARITLGMNAECTDLIAGRGLYELEAVAEARPAWVRPRWEGRLDIWRQLLRAASADQANRLRQLQLRGVQLLAGSLLVHVAGQSEHRSG